MRPVGMVFRPSKESASNVGRQAAEGSEVAPLWLVWGLGATLRPASNDAEAWRRAPWSQQVVWTTASLTPAPPRRTMAGAGHIARRSPNAVCHFVLSEGRCHRGR